MPLRAPSLGYQDHIQFHLDFLAFRRAQLLLLEKLKKYFIMVNTHEEREKQAIVEYSLCEKVSERWSLYSYTINSFGSLSKRFYTNTGKSFGRENEEKLVQWSIFNP